MIISAGEQFERAVLRENEYESVVRENWSLLHADSKIFEWKPLVKGNFGSCKPDALVVFNNFQSWAVVEFELTSHATSHFEGQFEALESADWARANVEPVLKNYEEKEATMIARLVRFEPPRLLCISDDFAPGLVGACRQFSFEHMVVTPFLARSSARFALRVEKIPPSLKFLESSVERSFQMLSDLKFVLGRIAVAIPSSFPNFEEVRIIHNDKIHVFKVHPGERGRRLYLDPEIVQERKVFDLFEVDPNIGLFRASI